LAGYILMLDPYLPTYDVSDAHSVTIDAPPAVVMDAVREVTPAEVPLLVALMGIRTLPRLVRGKPLQLRGAILDGMRETGFIVLEERPDAMIFGVVGRFWEPASGIRPIEPEEFHAFDEPGFAKAAFGFWLDGGVLTTETRVVGTDERATRRFRWYWRVIYPGSAVIRWEWLRAIRRRAERAQASSSPRSARA
jgi:hypothetical protein